MRTWVFASLPLLLTMLSAPAQESPVPAEGPPAVEAPSEAPSAPDAAEPSDVMTLEEALEAAVRSNPSLAAAQARIDQARHRAAQARATFFPFLGAGATWSQTWLDENTVRTVRGQTLGNALQGVALGVTTGGQTGGTTQSPALAALTYARTVAQGLRMRADIDDAETSRTLALSANWLLFDGFEREFTYLAARLSRDEFEAAYDDARRLLMAAVAQAYHAALLAREDVGIAEADEAFNLRQLEEAQARRRVGTGSLSDVLNFEVRANQARAQRIREEQNHATALIALAELLDAPEGALPPGTALEPLDPGEEFQADLPDIDALVAFALEHRPDLEQSGLAVSRSQALVRARRGAFLPSVTARATRSAIDREEGWPGRDDLATTVSVDVNYEIFAGGLNRARYQEARAAHREARFAERQRENAVVADVREAHARLSAARQQLWLQRANAEFVQRNRDLVEREYRAGVASLVRLNEAQRDLLSAQGELALARVQVRQSLFDLETATGGTLDRGVSQEP